MLKLENLTVEYQKNKILENVSVSFVDGTITAITGRSGIGKTTLLRVLCGLKKPSDGKVLSSYNRPAYIFQEPRLFPWMTALENVLAVCNDEEKARHYLSRLLPDEGALLKYPHELSGGMKQRVSIARAIAYEPDLLLMDEPFRGLDPETKEETVRLVLDSIRRKTVLTVTHDEEDLVWCDFVLRMENTPASHLILEKIDK